MWCKTITFSGSHSACICAIHHNTVLGCCALNLDYQDQNNKVVCSNTNKLCVVYRGPNYLGKDNVVEYLYQTISDNTEDKIDFEWESTDRTTIVNMVMEKFEFVVFGQKN